MMRREKSITTKDGYVVKKHTITLHGNRYYSISKDGKNKGWYSYRELFDSLALLRV